MLARSQEMAIAEDTVDKMIDSLILLEAAFPSSILDMLLHKMIHVCEQVSSSFTTYIRRRRWTHLLLLSLAIAVDI